MEEIKKLLNEYKKKILTIPEYITGLHWNNHTKITKRQSLNPKYANVVKKEQEIIKTFRTLHDERDALKKKLEEFDKAVTYEQVLVLLKKNRQALKGE
jgi:uncharacterized coiled-coil DUF342 family protein